VLSILTANEKRSFISSALSTHCRNTRHQNCDLNYHTHHLINIYFRSSVDTSAPSSSFIIMRVDVPELCYHATEDGIVPIMSIDMHTGVQAVTAEGETAAANSTSFTRLVTAGQDNTARVWQLTADAAADVAAASAAPTATAAAVAALRRTQVTFLAELGGGDRSINVVRFAPNGQLIATAGDG
jgi:WD40 repeat protein